MAAKKTTKKAAKKSVAKKATAAAGTAVPATTGRKKVTRLSAKARALIKGKNITPRNLHGAITALIEDGWDMQGAHGQVVLGLVEDAMNGDHAARKLLLERLDAVGVQAPTNVTVISGVPHRDAVGGDMPRQDKTTGGVTVSSALLDDEGESVKDAEFDVCEPPGAPVPQRKRRNPGTADELSDDEIIAQRKRRRFQKARATRERNAAEKNPSPTRIYPGGDGPRVKQAAATTSNLLD